MKECQYKVRRGVARNTQTRQIYHAHHAVLCICGNLGGLGIRNLECALLGLAGKFVKQAATLHQFGTTRDWLDWNSQLKIIVGG
jgi:hypothetical protein